MSEEVTVELTVDEALSLLSWNDGYGHSLVAGSGMVVGADSSRTRITDELKEAERIEIGGPTCRAMGHPIVATAPSGRVVFYEADLQLVEAFEREHLEKTQPAP